MGKKKKLRDRASKQYTIAAWVILAILVVVIYLSLRGQKENRKVHSSGNVSSVQAPTERSKGYSGPASPQFNNDLIKKGKQDAKQARQKGESFVAPMTNGEDQPDPDQFNILKKAKRFEEKKPPVKMEPKPIEKTVNPVSQAPPRQVQPSKTVQVDHKKAERIRKSLEAQLAMISKRMVYKGHTAMEYKPVDKTDAGTDAGTDRKNASPQTTEKDSSFNMVTDLGIKPGDVFYASNMQTLNTDTPAPVATVEILSGPMKYGVAQGTFELMGENIRFTFTQLTDKSGQRYEMEGFAVDPSTKFAGVASDVDHHYLQRWGGLIAASFLSGYADAVEKSGSATTANVTGGIITSENPVYDLKDKFWIASGEVAANLSDAARENFNRAVTAWLRSNHPVGVLVIDLKPIK